MRNTGQIRPPTDPFEFTWRVRRQGPTWVRARRWLDQPEIASPPPPGDASEDARARHFFETERAKPVLCLTDGVPSGEPVGRVKVYKPMSGPGMFLTFAETEPTEKGILSFANRFGTLLGTEGDLIRLADADHDGQRPVFYGEPAALWHDEIIAMREAVRLWEALRSADPAGLTALIRWEGKRAVRYTGRDITETIAGSRLDPELGKRFTQGDVRKPGQVYLQRLANEHVRGQASPRLLFDRHFSEMALYVVPHTLLGALWLQFIKAVDGNRIYRRCVARGCRQWFEIGPDAKRKTAVTCSAACRVRMSRDRRSASPST